MDQVHAGRDVFSGGPGSGVCHGLGTGSSPSTDGDTGGPYGSENADGRRVRRCLGAGGLAPCRRVIAPPCDWPCTTLCLRRSSGVLRNSRVCLSRAARRQCCFSGAMRRPLVRAPRPRRLLAAGGPAKNAVWSASGARQAHTTSTRAAGPRVPAPAAVDSARSRSRLRLDRPPPPPPPPPSHHDHPHRPFSSLRQRHRVRLVPMASSVLFPLGPVSSLSASASSLSVAPSAPSTGSHESFHSAATPAPASSPSPRAPSDRSQRSPALPSASPRSPRSGALPEPSDPRAFMHAPLPPLPSEPHSSDAASPCRSSAVRSNRYSGSARHSSSTRASRASVWTMRSTATSATQYSLDLERPPLPDLPRCEPPHGLGIVADDEAEAEGELDLDHEHPHGHAAELARGCGKGLGFTIRARVPSRNGSVQSNEPSQNGSVQSNESMTLDSLDFQPHAQDNTSRHAVRPHVAPISTAPHLPPGAGKLHLEGKSVREVAVALASIARDGPVQHMDIPGTYDSRLDELLDVVLPTMSGHLLTLDVSDCNLQRLPLSLSSCTSLRELRVSGNTLGNPPPWIGQLANLRTLVWDDTGATEIPESLASLHHLASLSLANNCLTSPPVWLYRLPHLCLLHIEGNPFLEPWMEMLIPVIQSALPLSQRSSVLLSSARTSSSHHSSSSCQASLSISSPGTSASLVASPLLPPAAGVLASTMPRSPSRPKSPGLTHPLLGPPARKFSGTRPPVHSKEKIAHRLTAKLKRQVKLPPQPPAPSGGLGSDGSLVETLSGPLMPGSDNDFSPPLISRTSSRNRVVSGPVYDDSAPSSLGAERRTSLPDLSLLESALQQLSTSGQDGSSLLSRRDDHKLKLNSLIRYLRDLDDLCNPLTSSKIDSFPTSQRPRLAQTFSATSLESRAVTATLSKNPSSGAVAPDVTGTGAIPMTGLGPAMVASEPEALAHVAHIASQAKADPERRKFILTELLSSEESYVKGLQALVDVYLAPLKGDKPPISPAQQRTVFGNVESLLHFHQQGFLPALRAAVSPLLSSSSDDVSLPCAIAAATVFVEHAAFLRMYATYINHCDEAQRIITMWAQPVSSGMDSLKTKSVSQRPGTLRKRSLGTPGLSAASTASAPLQPAPSAASSTSDGYDIRTAQRKATYKYLKRAQADPRSASLGLGSYLLLPVQRIPRYRLLLEGLLRSVPGDQTAEGQSAHVLVTALASILRMARGMNEAKRQAELERRLCAWQECLGGLYLHGRMSVLVQPHRRLVKDGVLLLRRIVRLGQKYVRSAGGGCCDTEPIKVDILEQEDVTAQVTLLLCSDVLVLLLPLRTGGSQCGGIPTAPDDPFSSDHGPTLRALIDLTSKNQLTVEDEALRLRDDKSIYYLSAASPAAAQAWATDFHRAVATLWL